jgi:cytochrome bd ubiquinol oxidase subunit I
VTGIPMEFQFGTNWAGFSKYAGAIIGQTLAMEGMFAFFLESAFIGALIWGEKRLGPRNHLLAAVGVATGSWLSGFFILVTNAFMQHPAATRLRRMGRSHCLISEVSGQRLENPIPLPGALSFLAYGIFKSYVNG